MHGCPPARGLRDRGYENPDTLITLISASPPLDPLVEDIARRDPAGHTGRIDKSASDICVSLTPEEPCERGLRGRGEAGTMRMRR